MAIKHCAFCDNGASEAVRLAGVWMPLCPTCIRVFNLGQGNPGVSFQYLEDLRLALQTDGTYQEVCPGCGAVQNDDGLICPSCDEEV